MSGLGFMALDLGLRVWGLGFVVQGLEFRVYGLRVRVSQVSMIGLGFRVVRQGFRNDTKAMDSTGCGLGLRVEGLGFGI